MLDASEEGEAGFPPAGSSLHPVCVGIYPSWGKRNRAMGLRAPELIQYLSQRLQIPALTAVGLEQGLINPNEKAGRGGCAVLGCREGTPHVSGLPQSSYPLRGSLGRCSRCLQPLSRRSRIFIREIGGCWRSHPAGTGELGCWQWYPHRQLHPAPCAPGASQAALLTAFKTASGSENPRKEARRRRLPLNEAMRTRSRFLPDINVTPRPSKTSVKFSLLMFYPVLIPTALAESPFFTICI